METVIRNEQKSNLNFINREEFNKYWLTQSEKHAFPFPQTFEIKDSLKWEYLDLNLGQYSDLLKKFWPKRYAVNTIIDGGYRLNIIAFSQKNSNPRTGLVACAKCFKEDDGIKKNWDEIADSFKHSASTFQTSFNEENNMSLEELVYFMAYRHFYYNCVKCEKNLYNISPVEENEENILKMPYTRQSIAKKGGNSLKPDADDDNGNTTTTTETQLCATKEVETAQKRIGPENVLSKNPSKKQKTV